MGNLIGELRYALRQFWVARIFTATAILTLAILRIRETELSFVQAE